MFIKNPIESIVLNFRWQAVPDELSPFFFLFKCCLKPHWRSREETVKETILGFL